MAQITINGLTVTVNEGTTVLQAARQAGFNVPALCYNEEIGHITSCMLCLVKDTANGRLFPSCSIPVVDGQSIITEDDELREARKTGLELLLSEHVGDCEAPCQVACPAHMNIPGMNRLIASNRFDQALEIVKQTIPIPSILGRICPAPCEGACHRKSIDKSLAICVLKRFVGDEKTTNSSSDRGEGQELSLTAPSTKGECSATHLSSGDAKKVAVIGAGPAGLSAAYYLTLQGVETTVFDKESRPGGMLRTQIASDILPLETLDRELNQLLQVGVRYCGENLIDASGFERIIGEFDAVVIATGTLSEEVQQWGLTLHAKGIESDPVSYTTSRKGVFAIGNVLRPSRLAVRSVGQGREVAKSVLDYLSGREPQGIPAMFNSRFGKLLAEEYGEYLKEAENHNGRIGYDEAKGYSSAEAVQEAARCLHCDCRDADECELRILCNRYDAQQKRFAGSARREMTKHFSSRVVYEPLKCIKCGICVKMTALSNETFGFTFIGRGFDVVIGVPFNESIEKALAVTAEKVAEACPTGALKFQ